MVRQVDARGLPCPRPVVETKKALQPIEEGTITVLVNSPDYCPLAQTGLRTTHCSGQLLIYFSMT